MSDGGTSGTSWIIPLSGTTTPTQNDAGFHTYMDSGFAPSGTFVSSLKDANPAPDKFASWSTISWTATVPANTDLKFQVAGSNNPFGPFAFVGPDETASTFFSNGGSLSQFDGQRYLKYKAFFTTTDGGATPTIHDVTLCYSNALTETDLVVTTVSSASSTVRAGATVSVTDTTRNNGTAATGATETRYYLSTDGTWDAGDVRLAGLRAVPTLAPSAESTGSASVQVRATQPPGTYTLFACADDENTEAESSEVNNCTAADVPFVVALPDLEETAVSNPPASALPDSTFLASDTVTNTGGISAGAASTTRYYLSLNAVHDGADVVLRARAVADLAPAGTSPGSRTVRIPIDTAPGSYYLIVCADTLADVSESDETNNCRASTTQVTVAAADLEETAITNPPASGRPGTTFPATDTATNTGGVGTGRESITRYYLSANTSFEVTDIELRARTVPALAPSGTSTDTKTLKIPTDAPVGTYYLLVCADTTSVVVESDEADNCRASSTTIVVGWPDMVITSVTNPPASVAVSGSFTMGSTAKNNGTVGAGPSGTRYYLSLDGVKDGGDTLLTGVQSVGALAAGASLAGSRSVTVPGPTTPGTYTVLACANDTGAVSELDTTNNCTASATTVTVTP